MSKEYEMSALLVKVGWLADVLVAVIGDVLLIQ